MCIKDNYNKILENVTIEEINKFMNSCEENCQHYGSCDYYSYLDDKLVELDY